jgi:hypothetical protein
LFGCIAKVDESIFELESPAHLGNQTATPEYTLTMIEKTQDASTDFAIACTQYVQGFGDQTEVISNATNFAQVIGQLLHNSKGVTRLARDDNVVERLVQAAKNSAESSQAFFQKMLSSSAIAAQSPAVRTDAIAQANVEVQSCLASLTSLTESLIPKEAATVASMGDDVATLVEDEMMAAARAIQEAADRIASLRDRPVDPSLSLSDRNVHAAILDAVMAMTTAIANLIKCATATQQEIVANGRGNSTSAEFYKKNNRWTEGLISAAKAVATTTNTLVEAADGVINGTQDFEYLIVASNEVAAATVQLVAAARVKSGAMSKTQDNLELASKAVTDAAKALVNAVRSFMNKREQEKDVNLDELSVFEFKKREMELQAEILRLKQKLDVQQRRLGEMRRHHYHHAEEDM